MHIQRRIIFSLLTLVILCGFIAACDDNPIIEEDDGPKPANQSDFIGTWETDYTTVDIAVDTFGFVNRGRVPNIVFEMNVASWQKVPCEVTFVREVNGRDVPDEEFSRDWRKDKTTYKITGTVTKNNSPYNDLSGIGSTQSIYLHHSGYSEAIYIGSTRTDASSGTYLKR
jgi:hypothetical protein